MALVSQGTTLTWNSNAIGEVVGIGGPTSSRGEIPATHLTSTAKEFQLELVDHGELSMTVQCKPSDTGQVGLESDFTTDPPPSRAWVITLPVDTDQGHSTATTISGNGRVSQFEFDIQTDSIVQITATIRITGAVTVVWGS